MNARAQDLFTCALELPAAERAASLGAEEFKDIDSEKAGDVIGPYKLREQIGEGGFGSVWVADQDKPVRRRVALKLVKAGMDTKQVIARFEHERQALAIMDHPNIAKVLDAGATERGRPFFVMELVRGGSIIEYCDQNRLPTLERFALFIAVTEAVRHAEALVARDTANGPFQLELIESLLAQAKGFATQANLAGISRSRQMELWQQAFQTLTDCQKRLELPELQRNKASLETLAKKITQLMNEVKDARAKLAAESGIR